MAALTIGAPTIAAATGIKSPYILVPATALGLLAGALAAPQLDRYKSFWDRQAKDDVNFRDGCLTDHRGRPLKVQGISDVTLMGVHPARLDGIAASGRHPDGPPALDERLPTYIPRDVDSELREKILAGGFVLLVGDSTAGKTRTAYEAVAAAVPDHVLIAPHTRLAMSVAVSQAERYSRWVLWLDGLEQFLGADGLTRALLARLLARPGHHAIVATMRAYEHARYADLGAYSETDQAAQELTHDAREVIKHAHFVHMSRIFTEAERGRADERRWDPRIADALLYANRFGIAEYLAAGPELLDIWRDAWEPGNHPRGAAMVAAAIDCRRAGLTRPIPRALILELHADYLSTQAGVNPRPETVEEAWAWATRPRRTTASFLIPSPGTTNEPAAISSFDVFDYLVDAARLNRDGAERVTDRTLRACIDYADFTEADRIGNTAHRTGRYSTARDAYTHAFRKRLDAFGPDDPGTLTSRSNLALVLHDLGQLDKARDEHAAVLASRSRVLGPDNPTTLTSRSNLALVLHDLGRLTEAEAESRAVLTARLRVLGDEDPNTLTVRHNLARVTHDQGRLAEAEAEFRIVLAARIRVLGPDHPNTLHSHGSLARALHDLGRLDEAEAEHMLELRTRIRLLDSAQAERGRASLTSVLQDLGRLDEAEAEQGAELATLGALSGSGQHRTLISRETFPRIIHAMTRLGEAEAEHRRELTAFSRMLGPRHPNTLTSRGNHARVLHALGRLDEAETEHRAVLEARVAILGPHHPNTLVSRNNLALVLEDLGRFSEAAAQHRVKLETCVTRLGPEHLNTLTSRANLATVLYLTGRLDEAAAEHGTVLESRMRILGPGHPATLTSRANLATVLCAMGQLERAEAEHRAVLEERLRALGPEHPGVVSSRANLATVLYAMGRTEEAVAEHRAVLDLQARLLGPGHPGIERTRDALIALNRTARADDFGQDRR